MTVWIMSASAILNESVEEKKFAVIRFAVHLCFLKIVFLDFNYSHGGNHIFLYNYRTTLFHELTKKLLTHLRFSIQSFFIYTYIRCI